MNHQYDGFAFVSKVRVSGGRAWGAQRFLQTRAYKEYKQTGGNSVGSGRRFLCVMFDKVYCGYGRELDTCMVRQVQIYRRKG